MFLAVIAAAMKSPRKILVVTVGAAFMATAMLVMALNIFANRQRETVERELRKLLGKEVSFASLEVHLFGWPGFAANELRIDDDPRFAATPVIRARQLILGLSLRQLLWGRIVFDSLSFIEPELQIITDETGLHNLALLAQRHEVFAPLAKPRPPSSLSFDIDAVRIDDGQMIYLDRSVKEAAELQLRDVDFKLSGLDPARTTRLRFAASLVESLGQDIHISGRLGRTRPGESWQTRQMNLTIQLAALHVPLVARAVATLREKLPRELDVTGPMSLRAKATGTLARPRLENILLQAPLFGSSEYNAKVTGSVAFSEKRTWEDAEVQGNLTLQPLSMAHLRKLRWFRQNFSPALVTDGAIAIYSRFEGSWDHLRFGALVRGEKSDWRYQNWLQKPLDRPAEIRARVRRQKNLFFISQSEIASGASRIGFSGIIDAGDDAKLQLRLYQSQAPLASWGEWLAPGAIVASAGRSDLNIVVDQRTRPGSGDNEWRVGGYFKLSGGEFKLAPSGRSIERANGTIQFSGQQAKFDNFSFRLGASDLVLDAVAANLFEPSVNYQLRSAQVNLADLPALVASPALLLKNLRANGTAKITDGALALDATVRAEQGQLSEIDFRDLNAELAWSATGLTIKKLSLRAFDGMVRADGYLANAGAGGAVQLSTQVEDLELRALSARLLPLIRDRLQGQLNGHGEFTVSEASADKKTPFAFKGSGAAAAQHGAIKDFNLINQLLLRSSGAGVSAQSTARLPAAFANLASHSDTVFDSLKIDFTLEAQRLRSDNLIIVTPDYTITGAGWIGLDRTTRWNGLIVLSPRLTQEIQRDYRVLRYLLDRRGRLAITFRIDGTIPNIRIRLDNRILAQFLRGGAAPRERERNAPTPGNQTSPDNRDNKGWLPNVLDRFFNR
ncbi:MAG: AsmA family protein [Deltaproteobacteria bacterium]|nr:AsmA family protein [Deltaproteobacteria bacterium]